MKLPKKVLLGVVHLAPLPGSPRCSDLDLRTTIDRARSDAESLLSAGFDGFVLENFGDVPFFPGAVPPHVLTTMTRIACELPREDSIVVVNVLRNDAAGALAVAMAADLHAIRVNIHCGASVTDQGIIEGRAADTLRLRAALAPRVAILADVDVKHATPLGPSFSTEDLENSARDTAYRGLADALIVTGRATGSGARTEDLRTVKLAVPDRPVLVGSGVTVESAAEWYAAADGLIVGTALKREGRVNEPVDRARAGAFVRTCRP
jgi:membrane complex biogenesis BtpA family protein